MVIPIDLGDILNGVILGLIFFGGKALLNRVNTIRDHQSKLYTQIGKIETWAEQHDKQDDERHAETNDRFDSLADAIRNRL